MTISEYLNKDIDRNFIIWKTSFLFTLQHVIIIFTFDSRGDYNFC